MNVQLSRLREEFTKTRDAIETLERTISEAGRDPNETERSDLDALYAKVEDLTPEMEAELKRSDSLSKVSDIISRITPSDSPARVQERTRPADSITPGEYAYRWVLSRMRPNDRDAVSEFETLERALQHQGTADNLGVIPVNIIGDVIKFVDASRPAVNSSRRLPMPAKGKTFTRPRATQFTSVAAQSAEGDVLASQKFLITSDTITKGTYGGVLNISEQDIDDSEPALLDLAIVDLAEQYAIQTDDVTCTAIETASTASAATTLSLTATSDDFIAAIAAAASVVYGTAKALPDVLYASIDRWAYLIGLTDDAGRPLFPNLAPQNAPGTASADNFQSNVMGLQLVVDPNFTANFFAVAASKYVETYENVKGLATLQAPSILETQVAYRGRFAANVYTQGFGALEA